MSGIDLEPIVKLAQSGELEAASRACDSALNAEPDNPELVHLRGLLFTLSGKPGEAIPFIRRAITSSPKPKYWSNLGNALAASDRIEEAERAFRKAIKLDANFGDAWFNLGRLLLHCGRVPEAAGALERVTRLNPADGEAWKIVGDTYQKFAQFVEATGAYLKAFELNPRNPNIAALTADCLERENRLDEARRLAEIALTIQPGHGVASLVMAVLERRAGRPADARARLFAMPDSGLPLRLQARREHELGVLDDRASSHESAYAHFARAKALQASLPDADQADGRRYLARLERLIEADYSWLAERRDTPDDGMAEPVFIVGFPRSGTTLLNQSLNGHPELHVMEETPVLAVLERRLTDMQIAYPTGLAGLTDAQVGALRLQYFDFVRLAHPNWDGRKRLVDKLPLNIGRLPLAARLFPRARVVLALRHPYDACLSGFIQLFEGNDAMANFFDLRSAALMYDRVFALWEKVSAAMPLPWMPLKYEELIVDPENQMRALIGFLGLPWTTALLDHTSTVAKRGRINTPSYQQIARPLHRESLGRWVYYARHFEPLEPLLRRHLKAWGYEATPPSVGEKA
ncbi:MAG: tetratricopeptide repeat-containing sulfotransferase family protein [Burkholderiales bacterium]